MTSRLVFDWYLGIMALSSWHIELTITGSQNSSGWSSPAQAAQMWPVSIAPLVCLGPAWEDTWGTWWAILLATREVVCSSSTTEHNFPGAKESTRMAPFHLLHSSSTWLLIHVVKNVRLSQLNYHHGPEHGLSMSLIPAMFLVLQSGWGIPVFLRGLDFDDMSIVPDCY